MTDVSGLELDCKTVGFFFLKISKEIAKVWSNSLKFAKRASFTRTPQSRSLFQPRSGPFV